MSVSDPREGRRLFGFLAAGVVDSFALAFGWTAFVLAVVALHGLRVAAACNGAMLVGVALSGPVTRRLETRLDGRALLRLTALVEAALRVAIFVLLLEGAPLALLLASIVAMNVAAWSGFAAMRAEAADARGAVALTWYAVGVGAIEACGAAGAALLLTAGLPHGLELDALVLVYAGSLLPTWLVARYARQGRVTERAVAQLRVLWRPLAGGAAVMGFASGLTLLAVPLAATLYGPRAVAVSALAFGAGAVLAPLSARTLERAGGHAALLWPALGALMVVGWCFAPGALIGLVGAQVLSGYAFSALEGTMDARVAATPGAVTSALAYASASRALGSAAAIAVIPLLAGAHAIGIVAAVQTGALVLAVGGAALLRLRRTATLSAARAPAAGA